MGKKRRNKKRDEQAMSEMEENVIPEVNIPVQETLNEEVDVNISHQATSGRDMETIGQYLKRKRESDSLSLKVVSKHTKISITNLENLEEDLLDRLPDKAYVAGYVKSYAKTLSLDPKKALEALDFTYELKFPTDQITELPTPSNEGEVIQKDILIKIGVGLVSVFALIVVISLFKNKKEEIETMQAQHEETAITPQKVSAQTPLSKTIEGDDNVAEQKVAPQLEEEKNTQTIPEETESKVVEQKEEVKTQVQKEEKKVVEEKKESEVQAQNVETAEQEQKEKVTTPADDEERQFWPMTRELYSIDSSLSNDDLDKILPPQFKNAVVSGKQNVLIHAVEGATWLTYKTDDGPIKKFVLEKGKSVMIRGDEARLFLGNIGVVKIFLNNKLLNIESRTGVKSLVFPQENRSKYVMPLFIYHKTGKVETSEEYLKRTEDKS